MKQLRHLAEQLVPLLGSEHWAIGGSYLLCLHGLLSEARDLDLVCTVQQFSHFQQLLCQFAKPLPHRSHPNYCSQGFARFDKEGIVIELMAGIRVKQQDFMHQFQFRPDQSIWLQGLPCMQLNDWLQLYQWFDRPERVQLIKAHLALLQG